MLKPITPCLQRPRQIIQFTLLLDDLCLCIAVAITLPDSGNLAQVVCGHFHSFARSVEGSAFAWGKNANGQLGIGTVSVCEVSPIKILINNDFWTARLVGAHQDFMDFLCNNKSSLRDGFTYWVSQKGSPYVMTDNSTGT